MKHLRTFTSAACAATAIAAITVADVRARNVAQTTVPVRSLTVLALSRDTFGAPLNVRHLPGGRVLLNDARRRRLLMLDSMFRLERIVLDSTVGFADSYGPRPEPLIPYLADSSIFVDVPSQSMLLITPEGKLGRAISAPTDLGFWTVATTAVGLDDRGRLLYSGLELRRVQRKNGPLAISMAGMGAAPVSNADSLPIVRGDFQARRTDTVAALQNFGSKRITMTQENDRPVSTTYINPLANGDAWTVMSDGTIAIVRGHDYHIDWITSDNKKTSTGKLPFDWKRVSDEDKQKLRDSAAIAMVKADSVRAAQRAAAMAGEAAGGAASGGGGVGVAVARGGGRGGGDGSGAPAGPPPIQRTEIIPISEMPDYIPPMRAGAVRGDRDNNLWILPATSAQSLAGELVYDVVNRKGELYERVRLPVGRSIIGFGPGRIVYLLSGSLTNGFQVERARIAASSTN